MLKVEMVSQETIKPSSPTPPHLRTHRLSWFDQQEPPSHLPLILFYSHPSPAAVSDSRLLPILKDSLSETLTLFPPFAGRMRPGSSLVDCNDAGASFTETRVHSPLSQLLRQHPQPDLKALGHLLPCDASCSAWSGPLLCVQVSVFSCGGVAIGVSVFPPTDTMKPDPSPVDPTGNKKMVTKRFVFTAPKLAHLRGPTSGEGSRPPTRVEAVSALIWRCAMRARAAQRVSLALVVVDIRGRKSPPLPQSSFGNLCTLAFASDVEAGDGGAKRRLEEKLRVGIGNIDGERVQQLQGAGGSTLAYGASDEAGLENGKTYADMYDIYYISSWSRFPVYESDFGWGQPVWVGTARFFSKNLVLLIGGRDGAIEAWLTLEEKEMVGFERDKELCSFTSPAPAMGEP